MNRYKQSRDYLLSKLPVWKRNALLQDESNKRFNTRIVDEFTQSIVELAESDRFIGDWKEQIRAKFESEKQPKKKKKTKSK